MTQGPKRMDPTLLHGFERVSVPVLERLNSMPRTRRALHGVVGRFNAIWIHQLTKPLWRLDGFEDLKRLKPSKGVLLVSNHRSFFDMFLLSAPLNRFSELHKRPAYPVRSEFFYNRPLGLLLNVAISGGSMWPPVFRDEKRKSLNPVGFEQLAYVLAEGACVGIHPEGKRNRGDDPYAFLPLKSGLGHLVAVCNPETLVIPCYVVGVGNSVGRLIRRAQRPSGQRGEPVRLRYAKPIRVGDLQALKLDAAGTTEHIFTEVRRLAERDRREYA